MVGRYAVPFHLAIGIWGWPVASLSICGEKVLLGGTAGTGGTVMQILAEVGPHSFGLLAKSCSQLDARLEPNLGGGCFFIGDCLSSGRRPVGVLRNSGADNQYKLMEISMRWEKRRSDMTVNLGAFSNNRSPSPSPTTTSGTTTSTTAIPRARKI